MTLDTKDLNDETCAVCGKPIYDVGEPGSPQWEGFCSVECMHKYDQLGEVAA